MKDQCYDTLRTNEQLGYVVWSGYRSVNGVHGLRVLVQSSVKDPNYLDERIETFLLAFKTKLDAMSEEEFSKFRNSRVIKTLEKVHSLTELHNRYNGRILSFKPEDFLIRATSLSLSSPSMPFLTIFLRLLLLLDEIEAQLTKDITLSQVQLHFTRHVLDQSTRRRVSSRVYAKKHLSALDQLRSEPAAASPGRLVLTDWEQARRFLAESPLLPAQIVPRHFTKQ